MLGRSGFFAVAASNIYTGFIFGFIGQWLSVESIHWGVAAGILGSISGVFIKGDSSSIDGNYAFGLLTGAAAARSLINHFIPNEQQQLAAEIQRAHMM